jgi:hypothetical protein
MLMNEKVKTMGNEEKLLMGDLINYEFDNENSLNFVDIVYKSPQAFINNI